jgi:hypothetical protein
MATAWNKEPGDLTRGFALAGGSCDADEYQCPALYGLIDAGFVMVQAAGRAALTDAELVRARELRLGSRCDVRHLR